MTNATLAARTYSIDPGHSEVGFTVRHAGISKVRGQFTEYSGEVVVAENFADSQVNVTIQSASVDTRDENRDNHLRSADFWTPRTTPPGPSPAPASRARCRSSPSTATSPSTA